jgi:hypothetical protein
MYTSVTQFSRLVPLAKSRRASLDGSKENLQLEITYFRSLKIWWSFIWRTTVLSIPVMIVMPIALFFFKLFPSSEEMMMGAAMGEMPPVFAKFFMVWLLTMFLMISIQTFAIRWMLKTGWSDFRLVAVPPYGSTSTTPVAPVVQTSSNIETPTEPPASES